MSFSASDQFQTLLLILMTRRLITFAHCQGGRSPFMIGPQRYVSHVEIDRHPGMLEVETPTAALQHFTLHPHENSNPPYQSYQ